MIGDYQRVGKDSAEFNQLANETFKGGEKSSPFKEGMAFTIMPEGYCFAKSPTTKTVGVVILLKNEAGEECELWLSTLLKEGIGQIPGDNEGTKIIKNSSTIAKTLQSWITPNLTNKEAAEKFVAYVGSKKLICTRQYYMRVFTARNGRQQLLPASLVGFEFAE